MSDGETQAIIGALNELRRELRGDIALLKDDMEEDRRELRGEIATIYSRIETMAGQGHEPRVRELERWREVAGAQMTCASHAVRISANEQWIRGFWPRAVAVMGLVSSIIMGAFRLIVGGK